MTPFGIILVITAVFSTQVIQSITSQPKKYRCISLRPQSESESESKPSWSLRVPPPLSVTKSSSTAPKSPATVSKSPSTGSKSPSSVPKTPSSVSKSSSSGTKSSSTVQKVTSTVTNSSRTANRLPPDSFSLFKLPIQLISSLLIPLLPSTIKQNTSSVISPQFSFQMPLTFSTIHHPNYLPCNTNNSHFPCNPLPGISNNIPITLNSLPGNTNNLPNPNSIPDNTNILLSPCNSLPCNTNTTPNPGNSLPAGNKNNSATNPCNSIAGNTNNVICNSFLGHSHKSIIFNWFCNYLLNKIQNVSCNISPNEPILTPSKPNPPATDNPNTVSIVPCDHTVTTTEDTPNDNNNTPNYDNTPNDNNTPDDNTPNNNIPNDNNTPNYDNTPNDNNTPNYDTPDCNTPNNNIPTSTSNHPIPPCIFTPISKIHKPCLPSLIHSPKPKPCSIPVTYSHSHIPLKYYQTNHAPCSPSNAYFNSLFDPTTYKSNADYTLNTQDKILLKILKGLISNSNIR